MSSPTCTAGSPLPPSQDMAGNDCPDGGALRARSELIAVVIAGAGRLRPLAAQQGDGSAGPRRHR